MNRDIRNNQKRRSKTTARTYRPQQDPDDIDYLESLLKTGQLVKTPPQDYDDAYAIKYANRKSGYIVSNDMFRDHMQKVGSEEANKLKKRLISFTFVKDDFLPNPLANYFD